MTTVLRLGLVIVALGLPSLAPAGPPEPDDPDLELTVVAIAPRPLIVGEDTSAIQLGLTLANRSRRDRLTAPLERSIKRRMTDIRVTLPDGKFMPGDGPPFDISEPIEKATLKAGASQTTSYTVYDFGYPLQRVYQTGKYRVVPSMATEQGWVKSNTLEFTVIAPTKESIVTSVEVPLDPEYAKTPAGKSAKVFVQQIKIAGRYLLFHRRFSHDGKVMSSHLLGDLLQEAPLLVTGTVHPDKFLFVAFTHTAQGMTVVTASSVTGYVERTSITEAPPPARPQPIKPKMPPENRDPNERE